MGFTSIIDGEKDGRSNEFVKKMVRTHNLVPNKFWIGDFIYYTTESKSKIRDNMMWDHDVERHNIKPSNPLKVIAIHKHDIHDTPWWYLTKTVDNKTVWFVEDGILPAKPDYKPRKTERTLESMGKPTHRFKTEKEFLKEYGENWRYSLGYAVFVRKMDYLLGEEFPYDIKDVPGSFELTPKEFSRDDAMNGDYTWNITGSMLTIDTPSYKPRKTERTLEAHNSFRDANEITILIRNLDEFELIHEVLKRNGYTVFEGFRTCVRETKEPINIFINLETGEITQSILSHHNGKWTQSPIFNGVWERELTVDDLPYIKRIIEAGRIIPEAPSYAPKRTIRKLDDLSLDESVNLDYLPVVPPLLTSYQQKQQYKIGDVVYIRPDAFDYFYDVNPDMTKWLGKQGVIKEIVTAEDIYDLHEYEDRGKGMKSNDLLLTIKLPDKRDTYFWFYRCLVNLEFAKPSYKPRLIDRTIEESFRSDYDINTEKYQERFGKEAPSLIPIEEIEEFYGVKFEDYCNDLYPELNESPDWAVLVDNGKKETLRWDFRGAFAFGYYKGVMYISPETKGHGSMGPEDERKTKMFDRNDFTFPGRIWTEQKLISFWKYPPKEDMSKVLDDVSTAAHVTIDSTWKIEVTKQGESVNIPINDYDGSEQRSHEELARQHVMSPLLKPKREVPHGYGSKNPSYSSKRAWDMASLTTESKWLGDFNEKKEKLANGKYTCIIFNINQNEEEKLYQFLKKMEIIGDIDESRDGLNFIILTKSANYLNPFQLYRYSNNGQEIRSHMKDNFHISMDKISPVMTFDQLKSYMDRTLIRSALDMYSPRKTNRDI